MKCRIGSLNCRSFKNHEIKDTETIAKIIHGEELDICALQEIQGKGAMNQLLSDLNYGQNGKWVGFHEQDSINRTGNDHYEYAFIWNTDHINLPSKEYDYQQIKFQNPVMPHIFKKYKILDMENGQKALRYEPLYGRFLFGDFLHKTKDKLSAPLWEIRVINTHLMFSKGVENAETDKGQLMMRRNELDVLIKNIYHKISDRCYKVGSADTAYTILLGDYNMNRHDSGVKGNQLCSIHTPDEEYEVVCIRDANKKKNIVTLQSELTTFKKLNEDDEQSEYLANNYDHFTYDNGRFEEIKPQISRVDITKYCSKMDYYKDVSDHLPIVIELNF